MSTSKSPSRSRSIRQLPRHPYGFSRTRAARPADDKSRPWVLTVGVQQPGQALLCFDGSDDAAHAIALAGPLLGKRRATVLTVWEPVAVWAAFDPGAVVSAGVSRLASEELGLDEISREAGQEWLDRGVQLANEAGFDARGKLSSGKPWRTICDVAGEIDAAVVVLAPRGLSRVRSALLGSVTAAVLAHVERPVLVVPCKAD
jgi:nucleotide-binding universal stress UspA family protein